MKVLMISQDVRVDRRIVLQAQTLRNAGYTVSILTRAAADGPIPGDEEDGGIPVQRVRIEGSDPRFGWLYALARAAGPRAHAVSVNVSKVWGALTAKNAFNYLAYPIALGAQADVYHAHDLNNLPVAYRAARRRAVRLAYDAHELFSEMSNPWVRVRRDAWRATEKRLLPLCSLATTVNEFIAAEMAERYHVPPPDVLYNCPPTPTGLDLGSRPDLLREKMGLAPGVRVVLYQGWMAEGRGLEALVRGAASLQQRNAVLALMGYGEHRDALESLAATGGLGDVVRFLEPVPQAELLAHCASADLGVIPYRPVDLNNYYSSPNKLFDFIQARTPILANDLPFLRKVVAGRDLGLVAEMTTPESVGDAMCAALDALSDPATAARWRHNLDDAAEVFNWEHEGEKLVRLYEERIGPPRPLKRAD
jgi:YD repeat-containing protein